MSGVYTVTDAAALNHIYQLAVEAATISSDPDVDQATNKSWVLVYEAILSTISESIELETGLLVQPVTPQIEAVWYWVQGAMRVNADSGAFATYIRNYTAMQYELRAGGPPEDGMPTRIQKASNQIAENFAWTFLFGSDPNQVGNANDGFLPWADVDPPQQATVPELHDVGEIDASGVAANVFTDASSQDGANFSPWAGTVLFANMGDASFFSDWMLNTGTSEKKLESGTYDLVSAAQVTVAMKTICGALMVALSGELGVYQKMKELGAEAVAAATVAAQEFFQGYYGEDVASIRIGDSIYSDFVGLVDRNGRYIIGTVTDDVFSQALALQSDTVVAHSGAGDDEVIVGSGRKAVFSVLDGGEGTDALIYRSTEVVHRDVLLEQIPGRNGSLGGPEWRVRIESESPNLNNKDLAYNFERIVFDRADDIIHLDDLGGDKSQWPSIDFGGQQALNGGDKIDAAAISQGVVADLADHNAQFIAASAGSGPITIGHGDAGAVSPSHPLGQAAATNAAVARQIVDALTGATDLASNHANDRLNLKNAESIITGSGNDTVLLANRVLDDQGALDLAFQGAVVETGAGDDIILMTHGGEQYLYSRIEAGAGDDIIALNGGVGGEVYGGSGSDTIFVNTRAAKLYGGDGADLFFWSPDTIVMDGSGEDRLSLFGMPLTGGTAVVRPGHDAEWVRQSAFPWVKYGLDRNGELVVDFNGRNMYVANYHSGSDPTLGIYTSQVYWEVDDEARGVLAWGSLLNAFFLVMKQEFKAMGVLAPDDPLILDLNGDGITLSPTTAGSGSFDVDDNWFRERTGWATPSDGFLVVDANGDGRITSNAEMFGSAAQPGFAELAGYDGNGDGVVDASDAGFALLQVWQDTNQNYVTDAGELHSLAELGITSLSLGTTLRDPITTSTGHQITAVGTFTQELADGTVATRDIAEVVLNADHVHTQYAGNTGIAAWASALPNVHGFGLLTDEKQGERLDRAEVVANEIRIADRAYLQPERMGRVLAAGADVIIRAPWNDARWLDAEGDSFNLIKALLDGKETGVVDRPVWIGRDEGSPLGVRLVAIRKPKDKIAESVARIEAEAKRKGRKVGIDTLIAAGRVILVTTLDKEAFPAVDIGALYRLRWRIEIAFKHLKSGLGLKRPPGDDPGLAKVHVLCHLLMALLAKPHLADRVGVSPRRAAA